MERYVSYRRFQFRSFEVRSVSHNLPQEMQAYLYRMETPLNSTLPEVGQFASGVSEATPLSSGGNLTISCILEIETDPFST